MAGKINDQIAFCPCARLGSLLWRLRSEINFQPASPGVRSQQWPLARSGAQCGTVCLILVLDRLKLAESAFQLPHQRATGNLHDQIRSAAITDHPRL